MLTDIPPPLAPLTDVPPLLDAAPDPADAVDGLKKRKDPDSASQEAVPAAKRLKEGGALGTPVLGSKPSIKLKLKPSTATPVQVTVQVVVALAETHCVVPHSRMRWIQQRPRPPHFRRLCRR